MKRLTLCIFTLISCSAKAASFSGQFKSTTDAYQQHLSDKTDDLVPYLQFDSNGKHKFTKSWRTQWRLLALSNLETGHSPENIYVDLPEAYAEKRVAPLFKVRAGMNTVNWGLVDVSSPSDTVNTSALFHPLRTLKRGAPMVQAMWGGETLMLDGIYIPRQQRPLLPAEDSRWLPRQFLLNIDSPYGKILVPEFLEYEYNKPETLDRALSHNYGFKLSSHIDSVDLQLTYFEGAAPTSRVRPNLTIDTNPVIIARSPIQLTPLTYRVQTTGAGMVWAREKWIYRLESAYQNTMSDDAILSRWSWASVLAVETSIDVGSRSITILGQYYNTENPKAADNFSSFRLFDRSAVLGARYPYSDDLTFIFSSLYETKTRGVYWSVGFDSKWTDRMKWGMSWRDFSAPADGIIKTYERNDHATLDLTYYF